MNCCNDYGICTQNDGCPARHTKRLYPLDPLGTCHCLSAQDCLNCNPLPPLDIAEKVAIAIMTICTLAAIAGLAGYLWTTYSQEITDVLYAMANRLG